MGLIKRVIEVAALLTTLVSIHLVLYHFFEHIKHNHSKHRLPIFNYPPAGAPLNPPVKSARLEYIFKWLLLTFGTTSVAPS